MAARKALFASTNYFLSPFQVGSHHLARAFARAGWQVAFVSMPLSPWHWLKRSDVEIQKRWECYRQGGFLHSETGIWAYVPATLAPPHASPVLRTEPIARHWWRWTVPSVVRTIRAAGFGEVDFLYLDSVYQRFWLDVLKCRRSLFRIADRNAGFQAWTKAAAKLEVELARSVDAVAYTARSLEDHVRGLEPKSAFLLPNGVDADHFIHGSRELPEEYRKTSKPIALYVGAMDVWFDFALVEKAARRLPRVSFVLIGPKHLAAERLPQLPNLHLLGSRPFAALPPYLHQADVGIIPFDVVNCGNLVHGINPLKMYEYMACGLPVVATQWDELRRLDSPAQLCATAEEFIAAIANAVAHPYDRESSIRFARAHDWNASFRLLHERLFG
jgi:glycosyltransferase involved in cell wall biosynthesis